MKPSSTISENLSNIPKKKLIQYSVLFLTLILIALSYIWIKTKFEKVQSIENLGYKKEALLNPYLAAQQFLEDTGIRTKSAADIGIILDTVSNQDTIILLNKRRFHPIQTGDIVEWISKGGHLIMSPSSIWNPETETSNDSFLDLFGIRLHEWYTENDQWEEDVSTEVSEIIESYTNEVVIDYEDSEHEDPGYEDGETLACTPYSQNNPSHIVYNEYGDTISINFRSRFHLEDTSGKALHTNDSTEENPTNHILQYPVGEGMLTVLSDQHFWKNSQLSWYDHGYLLWMLVSDSETSWFVFDIDSPNLIELLWETANYLIICLAVCLALILWQRGRRFGPMLPDAPTGRRQLLEHIEASAQFAWNNQQFESSMTVLLNGIRQQLRITHNITFDELGDVHNDEALIEKIALITQIDKSRIRSAFMPSFEYKEQAFVQRIKLLQQLRNQL